MSALDGDELLYNLFRFAFAGCLLLFLAMMVRVMLREIDQVTRDAVVAEAPATAWFMILDGGSSQTALGQSLMISKRATIGRSAECDLVFDDSSISAIHAAVFQSDGDWLIEDFESMNGTYVGGRPVRSQTGLEDGDVLQFGRVRVRFMC